MAGRRWCVLPLGRSRWYSQPVLAASTTTPARITIVLQAATSGKHFFFPQHSGAARGGCTQAEEVATESNTSGYYSRQLVHYMHDAAMIMIVGVGGICMLAGCAPCCCSACARCRCCLLFSDSSCCGARVSWLGDDGGCFKKMTVGAGCCYFFLLRSCWCFLVRDRATTMRLNLNSSLNYCFLEQSAFLLVVASC